MSFLISLIQLYKVQLTFSTEEFCVQPNVNSCKEQGQAMKILESSGLKTPISCTFVKNDIDSFFSDLCRHIAMP